MDDFTEGFKMIADYLSLCFCDIIEYKGYGWFSNNSYNGLFKINLENGDISWEAKFQSEEDTAIMLHRKILRYEDFLFFFPERGKTISVYNIALNHMESISLQPFYDLEKKCNVNDVVMQDCENCIIFPQHVYQPLLKMNLRTRVIVKTDEWNFEIKRRCPAADLIADLCMHSGKAYCLIPGTHTIFETEFNTLRVKEYFVSKWDLCGAIFTWDSDRIWTVNSDCTKLMSFDLSDEATETIRLPEQFVLNHYNANGIIATEEYVILLPGIAEEIILYHKQTKEFSVLSDYPDDFRWKNVFDMDIERFPKFYGSIKKSGFVYLFPFLGTHMLKLNLKNKQISNVNIPFCYTKQDSPGWKVLNEKLKAGRIKEYEGDLEKFLNMIEKNHIGTNMYKEQRTFQNGKNIFEYIKKADKEIISNY